MGHAHAMGLHRVALAVVKVADIGVVEVRDLLLARHRSGAARRLGRAGGKGASEGKDEVDGRDDCVSAGDRAPRANERGGFRARRARGRAAGVARSRDARERRKTLERPRAARDRASMPAEQAPDVHGAGWKPPAGARGGGGGGAKTRARGRGSARGAPLRDEIRGYGVGRGRVRRARASEVRAEGGDARASAPPRPSTKNFPHLSFGRWWAAARFDSNRLADQSLSASHRSTVRNQRYEGENSSLSPGPRSRRSRRSRRASSETGLSGARLDFADVSVDALPGTRRVKMAKVEPVRRASGRRRCCPFPR